VQVAAGVASIVIGLVGFGGQLISVLDWPLAQRLGLQESQDHTDTLFRRLERNTAIWDLCSWWTLPVAGALMVTGHPWWPVVALLAGGVYMDTAGREWAKLSGLGSENVKTGEPKDARRRGAFFIVTAAIAVWAVVLAVMEIV